MKTEILDRKTYIKALPAILVFLVMAALFVLPANAALQSVGGDNPSNGFPNWYADIADTKLGPCIAGADGLADPLCVVLADATYNPALALSFPDNFPGEFFYWIADSDVLSVGPNLAGKATIRMALEGTFATADGSPGAGQQMTFLRVNLKKISGLRPSSTYKVTYPFGKFEFKTDALGNSIVTASGQTYRTEDGCLGAPCDFTLLLPAATTQIGGFLKAVSPAPPAGYIGDPGILQTITPGPNGNNFRIDGPDVGGRGVNSIRTTLWSVAGKIYNNPNQILASITITPAGATVPNGSTQQFTATGTDQLGEPMVATVVWTTGDPLIGTIDPATGLFTALAEGTVTVTATSGAISQSVTVVVSTAGQQPVLTTIIVNPAAATVTAGKTQQYIASAFDQFGGPYPTAITWTSSDPLVGTIDPSTGLFASMGTGTATISAVSGAVNNSTIVTVTSAALQGVGPTDLATGFPLWYQDSAGTKIEQCLAGADGLADPLCVVLADATYNPALAVSFPGNFPGEFFYWIADSDKLAVGPNRAGIAVFRMALEGTFATGGPEVGQQITFLRVNLKKMSGLEPGKTFTVTYPFGSFTFRSDNLGNSIVTTSGQAYRVEDGSFIPGAPDVFSALLPATNTKLSTFLTALNPAPPAGYLGDPAILQTITSGGPNGNFLKIDGPNIGGKGINTIQTDLWNVAGKIYSAPVMQTIYSIDPPNNAVNVPVDKTIVATFSEGITEGTTYDGIVLLKDGKTIDISKKIVNNILSIDPVKDLASGKTYTLVFPQDSVEYTSGTYLPQKYVFTFNTADKPCNSQGGSGRSGYCAK